MKINIGTTVLGAGSQAGEPGRIIASLAKAEIEISPKIDSDSPDIFDRRNRTFTDTVEVDYSFGDFATAQAAIPVQMKSALNATGSLVYGTIPNATAIGAAKVQQAELLEFIGCGFTIRYTIIATELNS